MWALFEKDGTPTWFGPQPVPGSEEITLDDLRPLVVEGTSDAVLERLVPTILVNYRRTKAGKWVKRTPKDPPQPTARQLAERAEAEFQDAVETRRRAVVDAMREEADPLLAEVFAGELDKEVWLAKRAEIRARYPKPDRPA